MIFPARWSADPARQAAPRRRLTARTFVGVVVALAVVIGLSGGAAAQDAAPAGAWEGLFARADAALHDDDTDTATLQALRLQLSDARSRALDVRQAREPDVASLQSRLNALGPLPEDGVDEPPDIAARRTALTQQLTDARAPLLDAQDAYQRAGELISEIDKVLVARLAHQLLTRGPSPLLPSTWAAAVSETGVATTAVAARVNATLADAETRGRILARLPVRLLLVAVGVAIAFTLRRRIGRWVEQELAAESDPRRAARIVAVRNLVPLLLPAVGAGLLFAAIDPSRLAQDRPPANLFWLPSFVWLLIAAGWLAGSLLAPRTARYRIVPLNDAEARLGSTLVLVLGGVLAVDRLLQIAIRIGDLSPAAQTALYLTPILLGSVVLRRTARMLDVIRQRISERAPAGSVEDLRVRLPVGLLRAGALVVGILALAVPVLAVAGFLAAARFFLFNTMMTLGVIGAAIVLYDVLTKTAVVLADRHRSVGRGRDRGLIPVAVGTVVTLVSIPLLAMVWGARGVDILDAWRGLHEGVTVSGMHLSFGVVLRFAVAFAIAVAVTRLLQSVLRAYVLPNTRIDAGGRNAILAGIGYTGFAVAGITGVSAAGLDLSNLAIVAGALSVGIGFGLQTVVSNFVSGIILLIERPIKEGDWIEVAGFSGYVRGISVRSTEIETFDRASVIVPNSDLVAGTVLNRTHIGMSGRLIVPVGVAYASDPREVERVLMEVAAEHPLILGDPPPAVLFIGFGADSMNFEIRCRLRDVNYMLTVHSDLNFDIVARFRAAGIEIPFPQRDLHIRSAEGLEKVAPRPAAPAENA